MNVSEKLVEVLVEISLSQYITYMKTKGQWIVEIAGIAHKLTEQPVYFHSPGMMLNNVMTELQTWFTLNNLIVNTEKTLAMSFHIPQNKNLWYNKLHLQVQTFHTILKQHFWAYT